MNSATPNGGESILPTARTGEVSAKPEAEEIASAIDPVHSTHSSGREKVLEHIFLGDLLRALWRMGVHDVQVLRPEVDRNGYEFMLGHERIRRSVQLKSTYRGGKANEVTVNRHLENESGTALELWLALFAAHRANRHGGYEPQGEDRRRLDELCHTLKERLAS